MKNCIAILFSLIAFGARAEVTLQNATLGSAAISLNGGGALPGLDIPAELFFDFESGTPTNLITVASLPDMVHGQYYAGSLNIDGGHADFEDMQVFGQVNPFRHSFNVNGTLYDGVGTRALNLLGSSSLEKWKFAVPNNVRNFSFCCFVTMPSIDTGLNETNIDVLVFNQGSSDFEVMQVVLNPGLVPSINAHCSMALTSTNVQAAACVPGKQYFVTGTVLGTSYILKVVDPVDWSILGTASVTCNGGKFNNTAPSYLQTGYLFDTTPSQIKVDNLGIGIHDDAVPNFGLVHPTTLTNLDVYSGLIGRYEFGEGSGSQAADDYAAAPLTLDAVSWTTGDDGLPAAMFNGTSSSAVDGNRFGFTTEDFSVSFRVNTTITGSISICGKHTDGVGGWDVGMGQSDSTSCFVSLHTSSDGITTTGQFSLDFVVPKSEWHDVVVTRHGNTAIFYVDGVDVTDYTYNSTHPLNDAASNSELFNVGRYNSSGGWLAGSLQELRIYNRVLNPSPAAAVGNEPLRIHNRAP